MTEEYVVGWEVTVNADSQAEAVMRAYLLLTQNLDLASFTVVGENGIPETVDLQKELT